VAVRGLIAKQREVGQVVNALASEEYGGAPLPEPPQDHYTYAGEIPWCEDTYPANNWHDLRFVTNRKKVLRPEKQMVLRRDGQRVSEDEEEAFWGDVINRLVGSDASSEMQVLLEKQNLELAEESIAVEAYEEEYKVFQVLVPVRCNSWESYHSEIVQGRHVSTPAREITELLGLCGQPQTFDLFEKSGRRASISFRCVDRWHNEQNLTYLRQDLMERFLAGMGCDLIWILSGERSLLSTDASGEVTGTACYKEFQSVEVYGKSDEL
jgi:hypothetical protein